MLREMGCFYFLIVLGLLTDVASTAERYADWVARLSSFDGTVQSQRAKTRHWQAAAIDETYEHGDSIRTLERSRARLQLPNETYWNLDQNSQVNLTNNTDPSTGQILLDLLQGVALFRSRQSRTVNFHTPRLSGANNGTEFLVEASDESTVVTVYDGVVVTWNEFGKLSVAKGQSAIARKGQAPELYIRVKPQDAVQWAIYYPPVIDFKTLDTASLAPEIKTALGLYRHNDVMAALDSLDKVPEEARSAVFHNLRAGLLLTLGRVDEAAGDIRAARQITPNDATALAQQAIVAVAQNDKDGALKLAQQAESENPQSVPAKLALSYAYQAKFNLEKARSSAQQAVATDPNNSLALTRLAELELSLGEHRKAENAARKALTVNPDQGRAQALLGFAQLMQIDISEARSSFEQAIRKNPSDPLSRFGLGLTKIRKGELKEGTEELEKAASLNPNDALIRSYLGKAYYEQKRSQPALIELSRAKELDPQDPTPYYYEALKKQSENRPIESIRDLQTSIDHNKNRAVYRSKNLLDHDEAARQATIGRIYGQLGFTQRALSDAWKGTITTFDESSTHRFLSDLYAYSFVPKSNIARVSELLQSQLLQSEMLTPVQPQLAESALFFLGGLGPSKVSLNEFNPIFARDRLAILMSGLVGGFGTISDEIVQSGVKGKFSYSIGQNHYHTDGFRPNSDNTYDIYNTFGQYKYSENTSIQLELRQFDQRAGDLRGLFDDTLRDGIVRRTSVDRTSERLGFRHNFTDSVGLIGYFINSSSRRNTTDTASDSIKLAGRYRSFVREHKNELTQSQIDSFNKIADQDLPKKLISDSETDKTKTNSNSFELQLNKRGEKANFIFGVGYGLEQQPFRSNITYQYSSSVSRNTWRNLQKVLGQRLVSRLMTDYIPALDNNPSIYGDHNYGNAYFYSNAFLGNVIATFGTAVTLNSRDFRGASGLGINTVSIDPKFGVIWMPDDATQIRAAWLRQTKRPFANNQTIEPTHVSGFNQLFDDLNGTRSARYGVGLDRRFGNKINCGFELSWRNINEPLMQLNTINPSDSSLVTRSSLQVLHRAYVYWVLSDLFSGSIEYFYDGLLARDGYNLNIWGSDTPTRIKTHRIPLGIRLFQPGGLFSELVTTYSYQSVGYAVKYFTPRSDQYVTLDFSVGWRMPDRLGLVVFGIKNVFNEKFRFQDNNFKYEENLDNHDIVGQYQIPGRMLFAQLNIAF